MKILLGIAKHRRLKNNSQASKTEHFAKAVNDSLEIVLKELECESTWIDLTHSPAIKLLKSCLFIVRVPLFLKGKGVWVLKIFPKKGLLVGGIVLKKGVLYRLFW